MDIENIYNELITKIDSSKILKNEEMNKHTSFKIGGKADIFVKAQTIQEIKDVLEISKKENVPIYILGNGTNILVSDSGIRGIVLMITIKGIAIEENKENILVTVGAGEKLSRNLCKISKRRNRRI